MIRAVLDAISLWAIPVMLVAIPLIGMVRRVKVLKYAVPRATSASRIPWWLASPTSPPASSSTGTTACRVSAAAAITCASDPECFTVGTSGSIAAPTCTREPNTIVG